MNRRDFLKNSTLVSAAALLATRGISLGQAQDRQTYYMVTFLSRLDYWVECFRGMLDAAEFLGVDAIYTGTPDYEIDAAVQVLDETIALQPAGILLTVMQPDPLRPSIDNSIDSGIPLVTFDADSPLSKRYSFVGTGNYYAGVVAARYLGPLVQSGQVAVTSAVGQGNLDLRIDGFRDTLIAEFPDVILDEASIVDNEGSSALSATKLTTLLEANPAIRGIFSTNAQGAVGIGYALREVDMVEEVHSIGFDYDANTLDLIDSGELGATLAQGTWQMGFWGMMFLYMVRNDLIKSVSDWQSGGILPLPPNVDTGVVVITRENSQFWRTDSAS
jgi:ribose transport system substrate-binding protein